MEVLSPLPQPKRDRYEGGFGSNGPRKSIASLNSVPEDEVYDSVVATAVRRSSCVPAQQGELYDDVLATAIRRSSCVPSEETIRRGSLIPSGNSTRNGSLVPGVTSYRRLSYVPSGLGGKRRNSQFFSGDAPTAPTVFRYKNTYFRQKPEEPISHLDCTATGAWLQVVAHQDDDLLFMNPSLLRAVRAGRDIVTIYLTAGDAGRPEPYWRGREAGVRAAYAQMAGVEDIWTFDQIRINGVCFDRHRLQYSPRVSLLFCQLPDSGTTRNPCGNVEENLRRLWQGDVEAVHPVCDKEAVSAEALIGALSTLMKRHEPARLNLLDCTAHYGNDHNDHHDSALFGLAAAERCGLEVEIALHRGYNILDMPQNMEMTEVEEQEAIFITYLQHDEALNPNGDCTVRPWYGAWLARDIAPLIGTMKPSSTQRPFKTLRTPSATIFHPARW